MPQFDPYQCTPYGWSGYVGITTDTHEHKSQQTEVNSLPNYYNMMFAGSPTGK